MVPSETADAPSASLPFRLRKAATADRVSDEVSAHTKRGKRLLAELFAQGEYWSRLV